MLVLGLILGLLVGFWAKELLVTLKHINTSLRDLRSSEAQKPQNTASFAEPMTRAEAIALMEQERIEAINR